MHVRRKFMSFSEGLIQDYLLLSRDNLKVSDESG